jgi:hypothetical protein
MKKDKKTDIIPVKASPTEKRDFSKLAVTRHMTLSALIRYLLHKELAA